MYPSDMTDAQWQVLAKHFAEMNKRGRFRARRRTRPSVTILDSQLVKTVSKGAARLHGQSDQFNWAQSMFGWNMQVIKRC